MNLTTMVQLGAIPAVLLVLAGLLVLHRGPPETAARRFLGYLLVASLALLIAIGILTNRVPDWNARPSYMTAALLLPSLVGLLALILLHIRHLISFGEYGQFLVAGSILLLLALFTAFWGDPNGYVQLVLLALLPLLLVVLLSRRFASLPVLLSLALLPALLFRPALDNLFRSPPQWLAVPVFALWMLIPVLPPVLAAVLITRGARSLTIPGASEKPGPHTLPAALTHFFLALALLAAHAYTIYWGSIWDQTSDGLTGIFYALYGSVTAIAAGMVLVVTLPGRWRAAGLLFAVLVPALLFQAFHAGWDVSYRDLTTARAARIAAALDQYYAREGRYPADLRALVPRDLLTVPSRSSSRVKSGAIRARAAPTGSALSTANTSAPRSPSRSTPQTANPPPPLGSANSGSPPCGNATIGTQCPAPLGPSWSRPASASHGSPKEISQCPGSPKTSS
jgi:hypothetical protein